MTSAALGSPGGTAGGQRLLRLPRQAATAPAARVYCLPPAGAGAASYNAWQSLAPPWLDVAAVRPPGRESRLREPPHGLPQLVDEVAETVEAELELPYALFGHSFGALVAFEACRALRRRGTRLPVALFVAARNAPHRPLERDPLHALPDGALVDSLMRLDPDPNPGLADPELMALAMPALRADLRANETYRYRPEPPLPVPIVAFGGTEDPGVGTDALEHWGVHTDGPCAVRLLPGAHFFALRDPVPLLSEIESWVGRALG